MIFRPSYKIEEANSGETTVILDGTFDGENGDIVLLIAEDGSGDIYHISQIDNSTINYSTFKRIYLFGIHRKR